MTTPQANSAPEGAYTQPNNPAKAAEPAAKAAKAAPAEPAAERRPRYRIRSIKGMFAVAVIMFGLGMTTGFSGFFLAGATGIILVLIRLLIRLLRRGR